MLFRSKIGLRTVDIGCPMLSMHSIRETAGTKDVGHLISPSSPVVVLAGVELTPRSQICLRRSSTSLGLWITSTWIEGCNRGCVHRLKTDKAGIVRTARKGVARWY